MSTRKESVIEKIKHDFLQEQDDRRSETFKDTLKDLAENSSLHGIPKMIHSRQIIVKILWCLLFLAAFSVFTVQLYQLFNTYYSYPSQTSVSLEFSPIAFPAITLCNMNPVRKSQLYRAVELKSVLDSYSDSSMNGRKKREATENKPEKSKEWPKESPNTKLCEGGEPCPYSTKENKKTISDDGQKSHGEQGDAQMEIVREYLSQIEENIDIPDIQTAEKEISVDRQKFHGDQENSETEIVREYLRQKEANIDIPDIQVPVDQAIYESGDDGFWLSYEQKQNDQALPGIKPSTAGIYSELSTFPDDGDSDHFIQNVIDKLRTFDKTSKPHLLKGMRRRKRQAETVKLSSEYQSISSISNSLSDQISVTPVMSSVATSSVLQSSTAEISPSPVVSSVATNSVLQPSSPLLNSLNSVHSSMNSYNPYSGYNSYYSQSNYGYSSSYYGSYSSSNSYSWSYSSSSYYYSDYWGSWYSNYDYDSWSSWTDYNSGALYFYDQLTQLKDVWDERVENFRQIVKDESLTLRNEIGHQKEDMIQSATFAGRVQNVSHFQTFMSTEYGNCYTIESPKYVAWRSGPAHGIKLTLNLELDEYVDNFSTGYGIRIVFHERGTYPLPSHEGITLSPATETNIGLRMVRIKRLGEPHGACIDGKEFESRYQKKYSISACYEFCRIHKAMQECECIPAEAPDDVHLNTTALSICNVSEISVKKCLLDVDVLFDNGEFSCDCRGPCKETVYAKTMSSTYWPTDDYLSVLISDICEKKNATSYWYDVCNNFKTMNYWELDKYNFLRVLVYYEDLNYESITEEPMYESVRFLSDIGGAMGLFLGASVLSFVEVVQLILEVFLYIKRKGDNKNRVTDLKK